MANASVVATSAAAGSELRDEILGAVQEIPVVLTVDELAALLRVNRKTVYEALARGEIPGARQGRQHLSDPSRVGDSLVYVSQ